MRALSGPPKQIKTKDDVNEQQTRELDAADEIPRRPKIDFGKGVAKVIVWQLVKHVMDHWPQVVAWFQSLN